MRDREQNARRAPPRSGHRAITADENKGTGALAITADGKRGGRCACDHREWKKRGPVRLRSPPMEKEGGR
jgi:hypothetical protein